MCTFKRRQITAKTIAGKCIQMTRVTIAVTEVMALESYCLRLRQYLAADTAMVDMAMAMEEADMEEGTGQGSHVRQTGRIHGRQQDSVDIYWEDGKFFILPSFFWMKIKKLAFKRMEV